TLDDLKCVNLPDKVLEPYIIRRGDVLFNRTNSQEWVGKVGIYRHDPEVVFASYLIRLLPDTTRVDNYYLGHVLGSYSAQCRIKRYATPGVQQVNINATNLAAAGIGVAMAAVSAASAVRSSISRSRHRGPRTAHSPSRAFVAIVAARSAA